MKSQVLNSVFRKAFIILLLGSFVFAGTSCDNKTARYQEAIVTADSAFQAKDYNMAMSFYKDAKVIKADETYPDQQISKIEQILRQQETNKKYTEAIKRADDLFNAGNYQEARSEYHAAYTLKSGENYPKQKISEIDGILAEEQEKLAARNNPYHIVVGSFDIQENARQLQQKLVEKGYQSELIPRYDGKLTAVTLKSFPDLHAAWNYLPETYEMEMFMDDSPWIVKYTLKE
ncbi:MAG: SPOR domain-containing protein [Bacteroidota bacterium]|nr:SPOR domain-containing protein [Bacteroidota bacterium]